MYEIYKIHLKCHTYITLYKQTKSNMNSGVGFQCRTWIERDVGLPLLENSLGKSQIVLLFTCQERIIQCLIYTSVEGQKLNQLFIDILKPSLYFDISLSRVSFR